MNNKKIYTCIHLKSKLVNQRGKTVAENIRISHTFWNILNYKRKMFSHEKCPFGYNDHFLKKLN